MKSIKEDLWKLLNNCNKLAKSNWNELLTCMFNGALKNLQVNLFV